MSTAALYNMSATELRAIQRELRTDLPDFATVVTSASKTKKDEPKKHELGDGYYFTTINSYDNGLTRNTYKLGKNKTNLEFNFKGMQYPACCGISILHDFYGFCSPSNNKDAEELLKRFFDTMNYHWQPNIQFVAVREAIEYEESESEYNDPDDDWCDDEHRKPIAWNTCYNVPDFVNTLINIYKPTLISSFVNPNSDNICDVYQFKNPNKEE